MKLFWQIFVVILLGRLLKGLVDDVLVAIGLKWRDSTGTEARWR